MLIVGDGRRISTVPYAAATIGVITGIVIISLLILGKLISTLYTF